MRILGLICEYNPFHNGHLHHIEESKRLTGADKVIVVMSGNFVQRGAPAIMPKHLRTKMALESGASLVLELPTRYATGSAEFFATGAVSLLHQLGCVDAICFGSECGDIHKLSTIADILLEEPSDYKSMLQESLKSGYAFPVARQLAMEAFLTQQYSDFKAENLLENPNNILGIEYIKALKRLGSSITPYTILRKASDYHDTNLIEAYSSASAIRRYLSDSFDETLLNQVPDSSYSIMKECLHTRFPIYSNDFSLLLHQKLLSSSRESLLEYQDMTTALANRIIRMRKDYKNFEQFIELIKNKNTTYTRISRALLHALLEIPAFELRPNTMNHYIRVLGFQKKDSDLLTLIKDNSTLPLLTKITQSTSLSTLGQELLLEDMNASNLYESIITHKFQTAFIHECEQSIVMI